MALQFRVGEVFEFSGNSGSIYGLTVRQDMCGGITIRNNSPDMLVVQLRSVKPGVMLFGGLEPDDSVHIHHFDGDDFMVSVKVMPPLLELLEKESGLCENYLMLAGVLTDLGILPEFVMVGDKYDFEVKIAA